MRIRVGTIGFGERQLAALGCLLYPFQVEFTQQIENCDLVICRESMQDSPKPLLRVRDNLSASLVNQGNGVIDLKASLIELCSRTLERVLNPRVALKYKLATRLPLSYAVIPQAWRDRFLKMQAESGPDLSSHILIENTRKVIKDAFRDLGFALNRKRSPSLVITHDVDTARGLEYAHELKAVEARLNLSSIWFLVTEAYDLDARLLRDLADGSTIGSHDTKHDGKLIQIHNKNDLVKRLKRSRSKLESIIDKPVDSFRSPLLQFSAEILSGLAEANYKKDFSAPTWEPSHPSTMSGFGVETVQPFEIGGILEVPLTLTQDHQVMNVLGLNTREATKFWVQQARFVRSIDGDIVLLVHPDYDFAQHPEDYQTLLEQLVSVNAEYTESS